MSRTESMPGAASRLAQASKVAGYCLVAIALAFGFAGCTITHEFDLEPKVSDLSPPSKVPLRIGVYYSSEFRSYKHVRAAGPNRFVVPIGKSSIKMLDALWPRLFEKAVPVAGPDPAGGESLDAVIEPSIDAFDFRSGFDADNSRFSVTYRFVLYGRSGVPVSSWTVKGDASEQATMWTVPGLIENDMRDAAEHIVADFAAPSAGGESAFTKRSAGLADAKLEAAPGGDVVSVTAKPLSTEESQTELLGAPSGNAGIVVLRVEIAHNGPEPLSALPWAARLVLPDGHGVPLASPPALLSHLEQTSQAGAITAAFVGSPIGLLVEAGKASEKTKARTTIEQKLRQREVPETPLNGAGKEEGLLYFVPAEGTASFDQASLRLWLSEGGGKAFAVEAPVSAIGYLSGNAKKK
jgi:hypothetical protein